MFVVKCSDLDANFAVQWKVDYADRIPAERVISIIKGVPNASNEMVKEGFGDTFSFFYIGNPIEMEAILHGTRLLSYEELARYVFFTATGEEFVPIQIDMERNFIGESSQFEVYLFYRPDLEYLKSTSLTIDIIQNLGEFKEKNDLFLLQQNISMRRFYMHTKLCFRNSHLRYIE